MHCCCEGSNALTVPLVKHLKTVEPFLLNGRVWRGLEGCCSENLDVCSVDSPSALLAVPLGLHRSMEARLPSGSGQCTCTELSVNSLGGRSALRICQPSTDTPGNCIAAGTVKDTLGRQVGGHVMALERDTW